MNKSFSLLLIIVTFWSCGNNDDIKKIGFVDNQRVLEEFTMSQELTQQIQTQNLSYQFYIDSLELQLKTKSTHLDQMDSVSVLKFIEMQKFVHKQKQEISEKSQIISLKYNEQVMSQLNSYLKEYGEQSGYQVILGANGQGALLYADESIDITDDVIQYVNMKYSGN